MADISAEITAFRNAVYGEDVRSALVSLANKLNDVASSAEVAALNAYKPNAIINNNNYAEFFTNADDAPLNEAYFINQSITSNMISNLPEYGLQAMLYTFGSISDNLNHGFTQLYASKSGNFYIRCESGAGTTKNFTNWLNIITDDKGYASGFLVNPNTYQSILSNANLCEKNTAYFINDAITSDMVSNLPMYGTQGYLFNFGTIHNNSHGYVQLFFQRTGNFFYRTEQGSDINPIFSNWYDVCKNFAIGKSKGVLLYEDTTDTSWHLKNPSTGTCYIWSTNRYYSISNNADLTIDLSTIGQSATIYILFNGTSLRWEDVRNPVGQSDVIVSCLFISGSGKVKEIVWNTPTTMDPTQDDSELKVADTVDRLSCRIFKRVVCCGDSYTSGYIRLNSTDQSPTNEQFAWPHYMENLTGNEWINCGSSGATSVSWQTTSRGLPKAQAAGRVQAYVVGLALNDASNVSLGLESDIGTDNHTYYAQMAKIIRALNSISPTAKIFVNTVPNAGSRTTFETNGFNNAIRTIVETYKNLYPVHCIDLNEYSYLYKQLDGDSIQGHYTAIGYERFAEIYAYILSKYINEHVSDFQDVFEIPYDES